MLKATIFLFGLPTVVNAFARLSNRFRWSSMPLAFTVCYVLHRNVARYSASVACPSRLRIL